MMSMGLVSRLRRPKRGPRQEVAALGRRFRFDGMIIVVKIGMKIPKIVLDCVTHTRYNVLNVLEGMSCTANNPADPSERSVARGFCPGCGGIRVLRDRTEGVRWR